MVFEKPFYSDQSLRNIVKDEISDIKNAGVSEIIKDISEIRINNINGFLYTSQGLGVARYYFISNSSYVFKIIDSTSGPDKEIYMNIVKQIFSTFKFID